MSEHLLKILLSELSRVRIRCNACSSVLELHHASLEDVYRDNRCPACKQAFVSVDTMFGKVEAVEFMKHLKNTVALGSLFASQLSVEFTVPTDPE